MLRSPMSTSQNKSISRELHKLAHQFAFDLTSYLQWTWPPCFVAMIGILAKSIVHGFTHAQAVDKVTGIAPLQAVVYQG